MNRDLPELFERYPQLQRHVAWQQLGTFPTPVEPLRLPDTPEGSVWVKRDDLSGPLYGGNKVRKLEFLLAEALSRGAGRIITVGSAGSHHALATTVYASTLGLPATLVLFPQPCTPHVARVLRTDAAWGAEIRWAAGLALVPPTMLSARVAHRSERPYVVPGGGSNRIGTLGYVAGALELAAQIRAGELPEPARIHVPGGTLGTAAGIALGLALAGVHSSVVITRVVSPTITNEPRLRRLVEGTSALLAAAGISSPTADEVLRSVVLDPEQLGRGYGHATPAGHAAAERFADAGLLLEPTYTAKTAATLLAAGPEGGPILFWNTFSSVEPLVPKDATVATPLPLGARRYLARMG